MHTVIPRNTFGGKKKGNWMPGAVVAAEASPERKLGNDWTAEEPLCFSTRNRLVQAGVLNLEKRGCHKPREENSKPAPDPFGPCGNTSSGHWGPATAYSISITLAKNRVSPRRALRHLELASRHASANRRRQ